MPAVKAQGAAQPQCDALSQRTDLRFKRKVDQGRMRTRWPIMDILCKVGCRLKITMSPSHMCRSTWKGEVWKSLGEGGYAKDEMMVDLKCLANGKGYFGIISLETFIIHPLWAGPW